MSSIGKNIKLSINDKEYSADFVDNNTLLIKESENDIFYFLDWIDDVKNNVKTIVKRVIEFTSDRRSGFISGCLPNENWEGDILLTFDFWKELERKNKKKIVLEGVVTEFERRSHSGRIYREEDYLPHIDALKTKVNTNNDSITKEDYNKVVEYTEGISIKLNKVIDCAEYITEQLEDALERIETLEKKDDNEFF